MTIDDGSTGAGESGSALELFLLRLRYKEGRMVPVEGNKPLVLDDPDRVFVVYTGRIDLFSVRMEDGQSISSRRHVLSAETGQLLFGMDPAAVVEGLGLLATGVPGTRVLHMERSRLYALAGEVEFSDLVSAMVDAWVAALSARIARGMPPKEPIFLHAPQADPAQAPGAGLQRPGEEVRVRASDAVTPRAGVLWIRHLTGSSLIADRKDLPPLRADGFLPLAQRNWLRVVEAGSLETISTRIYLQLDPHWESLSRLHGLALQAIRAACERDEAAEQERLQDRSAADRVTLENALGEIASVLDPTGGERPTAGGLGREADTLLQASLLVGAALKIDMRPALQALSADPDGSLSANARVPSVERIARAAAMRTREVALKGRWWRQDNGPLLGALAENGRWVALLPASHSSYALHDPVEGTVTPVTPEVAARLAPTGHVFYRPFPRRRLTVGDVLKFGVFGCWRDLNMVLLMGIGAGILSLATPIATQIIFDQVIPSSDRGQLMGIGLVLLALAVAAALFQVTRSIAVLRVEGKMDGALQAAIWDRLLSLPPPFFRNYSAGDLGARAMGINTIRSVLSGPVITSILSSIFSLFSLVLMFYYDALLALVASGLIALAVAVTTLVGYLQVRQQRKMVDIQGDISGFLLQVLNGIASLRIIGAESRVFGKWAAKFAEQRRVTYKVRRLQNAMAVFNAAFPIMTSLTIFAIVFARGGGLSEGTFVAFTTAFGQVLMNGLQLSTSLVFILSIIPTYERAKPILQTMPEVDASKVAPGELTGAIEVSHVSFRYRENGPLVLQDVSLQVRPGEFVALVGPSGSGKSTLLRLLLGFERPEAGAVYYNGHDLAALDVREVRRQIGTVIQSGKVMAGVIVQNIIGSSLLTLDDAWEAARMAGLDEDIKRMPMGMLTLVSEEGGTFSGGQRQRLLIARALAHKPRIVFFDEATSALDNATQEIVSRSLEKLNATRVVIAHRLSTIVHADRIYVLQDGRVVQSGTYGELIQQPGLFADLAKRQIA
jgi:ATP-binding cassette subfamily C protein